MPPGFKPIQPDEQSQALDLWHSVFNVPRDYFARYYAADPWYQQGDSFGAWVDGALVSAVHLCRRPLSWEDGSLLCGGIANVATLPEYRSRGLSRQLLSLAITRMEEGGFAFSKLGTGIPDFYAALGWESIQLPHFEMALAETVPSPAHEFSPADPTKEAAGFYAQNPRVFQLERPEQYFEGWVGWSWASSRAQMLRLSEGYVVLELSEKKDQPATVQEWRAVDSAAEAGLLREAVAQAHADSRTRLAFAAIPQHIPIADLEVLGTVEWTHSSGQMIRNVSLSESDYDTVRAAYLSGQATWWPADGF